MSGVPIMQNIRANQWLPSKPNEWFDYYAPVFVSCFMDAICVNADNIAEYIMVNDPAINPGSIPCIRPPFDHTWIEYSNSRLFGGTQFGNLLTMMTPSNGAKERYSVLSRIEGKPDFETTDYMLRVLTFAKEPAERYAVGPYMVGYFPMDDRGVGVGNFVLNTMGVGEEIPVQSRMSMVAPALFAVSFMHCKNVAKVDGAPSRQAIREAERKNKPLVKFYTLQIEPMRQTTEYESKNEPTGIKKSLHICRGHFSVYTEDKPLFGKYSGQFWVPAHTRGSMDHGVIAKDYKVLAPRQDARSAA